MGRLRLPQLDKRRMTDWNNFKVDRDSERTLVERIDTILAVIFLVLLVGAIIAVVVDQDQQSEQLIDTLQAARQVPAGAALPTHWARQVRGQTTLYYSAPQPTMVCDEVTRPVFELPEGVISVDVQKGWCQRGGNIMVFEVRGTPAR